jgi:hypothetical protein
VSVWIWISVGFVVFLIVFALFILTLYKLHTKHIIEVRIPKRFRVWCFKNYISPEEIKAIEDEKIRLKEIRLKEEL